MRVKNFKLRNILLIVNLTVLMLPLLSLVFFRIYENELVKQTEGELIAQASFIAAQYKQALSEHTDLKNSGVAIQQKVNPRYTPIPPSITLSKDKILPPRPEGKGVDIIAGEHSILAANKIFEVFLEAQRTTLSGLRLLDHQGVAIAGKEGRNLSYAHIPEIQKALKGNYQSVIRERIMDNPPPALASISRGTAIRIFIAYPIIAENRLLGVVYMSRTPQNIVKHLYAQKEMAILAAAFLLCITLTLALLTSYTIARPIHRLIAYTKHISNHPAETIKPLKTPVTHELAQLSQSFSRMAKSLQDRSEYIKTFANHVSHEFKTPLTSIRGATELMLEHSEDMPKEKKERFLENILKDTERLKQLVTRLLELAEADNIYKQQDDTCELSPTLKRLKKEYEAQQITLHIPKINASIAIHQTFLDTIFINLFDNSMHHGASEIHIKTDTTDNHLTITITDNGSGISKGNQDKLFTPFFTTRRDSGGTGLGLAIIKSLLEAHNGSITSITSQNGASFKLTFPI